MAGAARRSTAEGSSDTARLEAFSDGVMAIAITLLVLDIHVPSLGPGQTLAGGLARQWPSYLAFVTSFLTIGIIWANHHRMFKLIARTTWAFLMINVVFLLVVSVIPFPTSLVADYLRQPHERATALVVYGATMTLLAVMFNVLWLYASNGGRLLVEGYDAESVRRGTKSYRLGPVLYAAITLLAFWNAFVTLALFMAFDAYWLLPGSGPG